MLTWKTTLITGALALAFGFGGAVGGVTLLSDQLAGPQGATGLSGPAGPAGEAGADGVDGKDGEAGPRGPRGLPGKDGKDGQDAEPAASVPVDLGTEGCSGKSMSVITDATITADQKLKVTRSKVCIVTPPEAPSTTTTSAQDG